MPLEEINPNLQKDATQNAGKQDGVAATTSSTSLRSSAVQSMLRNTTELGDTGLFAVRPPRIPRSGSRMQSSRRRFGSFDASYGPQLRQKSSPRRRSHRHHGPRTVHSSSALSGRETVNSGHTSLHSGVRSRRAGHGNRPHGFTGHGSGLPPHALHTHRSMVTLRSQRTFQSLHSGSPMYPPSHGRLPGQRASSPAFTEAYRYRGGPRHGYPRVGSVDTVASSPVMAHQVRSYLPGYRSELNNSSSSVRLPSPAVSFIHGPHGYPLQREGTPMSVSLHSLRPGWNHSAASFRGLAKSPTESTAPHYYDYSESFLEEDCFSPPDDPSAANMPFNMDQTIMENQMIPERRHAQSPFGTLPGSTFHPLELPTSHNRRPSDQSKHSYTGVIPPRKSSLAATTGHKRSTSVSQKVSVPNPLSSHPPSTVD